MSSKIPICAIFDIGKTNKKLLVFDENYQILQEKQTQFEEISDEDGFLCENLLGLTNWLKNSLNELLADDRYELKSLNVATYGASFVHLDKQNKPITPLYNYLKPFPPALLKQFREKYGDKDTFCLETASPELGMLNAGLQIYWLKNTKSSVFSKIKNSLHFPQYCASIFSQKLVSETTSLGCHTALWNFQKQAYHRWVEEEHLTNLEQEIVTSDHFFEKEISEKRIKIGVGIHDSSAALVPYLQHFKEPFVLLSTGTWCISLNPFNDNRLTTNELQQNCLSYLSFEGKSVKAARLFAGNEHERQTKHLAAYFGKEIDYYKTVEFDKDLIWHLRTKFKQATPNSAEIGQLKDCPFVERNINLFKSYEEAYHQFMLDLIAQQTASLQLVIGNTFVQKIFVDGGFSKNIIFMKLLAEVFYDKGVFASEIAQATSLGAAMVLGWGTFEGISTLKY